MIKNTTKKGFAYGTKVNDFLNSELSRIAAKGRVLCLAEDEGSKRGCTGRYM
ncbi:hypothetical protein [Psychromonas sp.]|uniref:hypothetical protein n=1 Tax=Psychromonas sp. TaxID=1884585 RepID=UPI00356A13D5